MAKENSQMIPRAYTNAKLELGQETSLGKICVCMVICSVVMINVHMWVGGYVMICLCR